MVKGTYCSLSMISVLLCDYTHRRESMLMPLGRSDGLVRSIWGQLEVGI